MRSHLDLRKLKGVKLVAALARRPLLAARLALIRRVSRAVQAIQLAKPAQQLPSLQQQLRRRLKTRRRRRRPIENAIRRVQILQRLLLSTLLLAPSLLSTRCSDFAVTVEITEKAGKAAVTKTILWS